MRAQGRELLRLLAARVPHGDALEAHRRRRLRLLLRRAYDQVPYYRARFDAAGIRPEDVRSVADLRHVPITTRDDLRAAGADARARDVDPRAARVIHTSGSSGQPLAVLLPPTDNRLRRAVEFRTMRRIGIRPSDVIATLGPHFTVPKRPLDHLGFYRVEQVSPLLPVDQQIARLRAIRPTVLWAYPTALRALLDRCGTLREVARPRILVHSAEPLDDLLRARVVDGGDVELRNLYGTAEIGRIAWECGSGRALHVNADCTIIELVDEEVAGAGRSVVVTNLLSHAMPFIRYRLGDRCEFVDGPCACGVPLPRLNPPVGREWDVIRLPGGRGVSPWGLNVFLRDLAGLLQFRLIQTHSDRLELKMRFASTPAAGVVDALRARILEHLGDAMSLQVDLVDAFADDAVKFRPFVSLLPHGR